MKFGKLTVGLMVPLLGLSGATFHSDAMWMNAVEEREVSTPIAAVPEGRQGFDKIIPYPYEDYTLENGLQDLIYPLGDAFPGLVSVQTLVKVGSREEVDEGKTGFAHFFEHMM